MATKSYNLGRVVGWSSYEEFLKENPDVDPSIVTAQRYYSATTYGVSRIVSVPTTGWSGSNILTKTVQVPGAIWGVVPILGLCYDEAQGMVPGTGAETNKQNYERAAAHIFACYVSDAAGNKVTNATSTSGYITFCAYPALTTVTGVSSIPFIVRGLGVEALTDNQAYWGPEGIVSGGSGNSGMSDGVVTGFTELNLSDGYKAYIIDMETEDRDSGTVTTRKYLSFAGTNGTAYNPAGSAGTIPLTVSTSGATNGMMMLDWDDLLRALVENKSLGLNLYDAISKILEGDEDGIEVSADSTHKKVIISNTAPYYADESHYKTLKQGGVDLSTLPTGADPDAYKQCDYVIDAFHQGSGNNFNNFVSYCGTDSEWADNDSNLSGLLHPRFSTHPLICYVKVMKSKVMVTYNGVEYPKSASIIIGGVANHKFDDNVTRQFYLGKKSRYTSGGAVTRTGFFYDDADTSKAPAFAFLHTDDAGSVGRTGGTSPRWYHGQYSWVFGVSFFGTNVVGDDYKFIHDMIEAGHYKLTNTTQGSSGIWNMKSVLGGSLGASWGGNAQVHLGKNVLWGGVRQCDSDILVLASSYADGYNTQMARWTKDNDVHGADLYSDHINLKVSCTLTWVN